MKYKGKGSQLKGLERQRLIGEFGGDSIHCLPGGKGKHQEAKRMNKGLHIVPHIKFDRIAGTSSATFPNFRYVAPREICVERNCFDSPIAK